MKQSSIHVYYDLHNRSKKINSISNLESLYIKFTAILSNVYFPSSSQGARFSNTGDN